MEFLPDSVPTNGDVPMGLHIMPSRCATPTDMLTDKPGMIMGSLHADGEAHYTLESCECFGEK